MECLILHLELIDLKVNIIPGLFFDNGIVVKLIEEGEYYNKYIFKNDIGDKFLLYLKNEIIIENNTLINIKGTIELPSKQRNKGGFDYSKYMYSQGLYGSIFVKEISDIEILCKKELNIIQSIQNSILDSFKKLLPREHFGIILGMVIGDTFYISDEIEDAFKNSGITHLLAVSGSNVSYIILVTKFLFDKIFGKRISNYITIVMVILFIFISGATPSVVRAGVMAIILIMSEILSKQPSILSTIATSAIIILIYNPITICDVGFILSFGGTLGIILLNDSIKNYFTKKFSILENNKVFIFFLDIFTVTISAQIILLPVMCYYFNTISIISIFTNLLVGPFVGIITILGLIMYVLSLISISLAQVVSYSLYILVSIIILISKLCSKIPYANLLLPTPTLYIVIIYYLMVFKLFCKISHTHNAMLKKCINILIILLVVIIIILNVLPKDYIEVNMIDVGQGDSILVKTNNYNILVDGGGSENSNYDVGNQILVPYLLDNTNGIIDIMFISHFHEDHAEGCISVLEKLKVRKIIIGPQPKNTELLLEVLQIAKEKKIPIIDLKEGDRIILDNVKFEMISPKKIIDNNDLNNNSMVIRMKYVETEMLFTGDIEKEAESSIIEKITTRNKEYKLNVDILKVAHHGSKTSSSAKFLEKIKPKIAIISLGKNNKFGHPNEEVIKRLEELHCEILRTDESGEISLKIYKTGKIKIKQHV